MPSWDLFEDQTCDYRLSVLPENVPTISIEALSTFGWDKYTHGGEKIGINTFGASGKGTDLFKHFDITTDAVIDAVIKATR